MGKARFFRLRHEQARGKTVSCFGLMMCSVSFHFESIAAIQCQLLFMFSLVFVFTYQKTFSASECFCSYLVPVSNNSKCHESVIVSILLVWLLVSIRTTGRGIEILGFFIIKYQQSYCVDCRFGFNFYSL